MSQLIRVVRCYSCELFQCDIAKKSNKWTCKICNEKQSLQKVYCEGTGKICREFVQKQNLKKSDCEEFMPTLNDTNGENTSIRENNTPTIDSSSGSDLNEQLPPADDFHCKLDESETLPPKRQKMGCEIKSLEYDSVFNDSSEDISALLE